MTAEVALPGSRSQVVSRYNEADHFRCPFSFRLHNALLRICFIRGQVPRLRCIGIADLPSNEPMNAQSIWAIALVYSELDFIVCGQRVGLVASIMPFRVPRNRHFRGKGALDTVTMCLANTVQSDPRCFCTRPLVRAAGFRPCGLLLDSPSLGKELRSLAISLHSGTHHPRWVDSQALRIGL
jgi:hypothetical protein